MNIYTCENVYNRRTKNNFMSVFLVACGTHSVQFVFQSAYGLLSPPYLRPMCNTGTDLPFSQLCQLQLDVCDLPTLQTHDMNCDL